MGVSLHLWHKVVHLSLYPITIISAADSAFTMLINKVRLLDDVVIPPNIKDIASYTYSIDLVIFIQSALFN